MKELLLLIFSVIAFSRISANPAEFIRCILDNDTTKIYTDDIVWMTRSEFKLTKDASTKLKLLDSLNHLRLIKHVSKIKGRGQIDSLDAGLCMFFLNKNNEWEKIWRQWEHQFEVKPYTTIWVNRTIGVSTFDEMNDVYRYRGKDLLIAAAKFNVHTINPAIKRVYIERNLKFNEIEIENRYLLNSIQKHIISDSIFICNKKDVIFVVNLEKEMDKLLFTFKMYSYNTIFRNNINGRNYHFCTIDETPFLFNREHLWSYREALSPLYKIIDYKKKLLFKEYYILNMDNWEIIHEDTSVLPEWIFEYDLSNSKITLLKH